MRTTPSSNNCSNSILLQCNWWLQIRLACVTLNFSAVCKLWIDGRITQCPHCFVVEIRSAFVQNTNSASFFEIMSSLLGVEDMRQIYARVSMIIYGFGNDLHVLAFQSQAIILTKPWIHTYWKYTKHLRYLNIDIYSFRKNICPMA